MRCKERHGFTGPRSYLTLQGHISPLRGGQATFEADRSTCGAQTTPAEDVRARSDAGAYRWAVVGF